MGCVWENQSKLPTPVNVFGSCGPRPDLTRLNDDPDQCQCQEGCNSRPIRPKLVPNSSQSVPENCSGVPLGGDRAGQHVAQVRRSRRSRSTLDNRRPNWIKLGQIWGHHVMPTIRSRESLSWQGQLGSCFCPILVHRADRGHCWQREHEPLTDMHPIQAFHPPDARRRVGTRSDLCLAARAQCACNG